ncbi:MAG TPA: cytochrome o ubiquinol oxidase subunit IV [Candidatus Paceibacterota bacterium]|nr:cytochrome o ubiquinol oxidase subunit IV [Candidatus Paceibacterota bacterium]
MSINHYFEEVGGWPRDSKKLMRLYVVGFVLSLVLTLVAYALTTHHALVGTPLLVALMSLAGTQFIVQIICFLHLDRTAASRERLVALGALVLIVLILVVGSLWIMSHLNERMMADPQAMEQYMNNQSGI